MIWTPEAIVGAIGLLGGFVIWLLRLEHRLSKSMTYEVYERLDRDRNQTIEKLLNRLDTKLDEREASAMRYRERVQDDLRNLWVEVAALEVEAGIFHQRRQVRMPPAKDTPVGG